MTLSVALNETGSIRMDETDIRQYAIDHSTELRKLRINDPHNPGSELYMVALYSGWVTAVTETGNIIQGWAGDFITA